MELTFLGFNEMSQQLLVTMEFATGIHYPVMAELCKYLQN